MLTVFIDADGCPVKDEVYRVAQRYGLTVRVVANHYTRVPQSPQVEAVVVANDMDAADNWIVDHAGPGDIVVTADIPLTARCLAKGARVVGLKGQELTEESIGDAVASRELGQHLRDMGVMTGGPAPTDKRDRSRFLSKLDEVVNAIRRQTGSGG